MDVCLVVRLRRDLPGAEPAVCRRPVDAARWPRVIVCVNLMDEAEKQGIRIDPHAPSRPSLASLSSARAKAGSARMPRYARLRQTIRDVLMASMTVRPHLPDGQKDADCVNAMPGSSPRRETVTGGQTRRHARLTPF